MAYSGKGNPKGQPVYVNYATPEDFDYLESIGIDVRGKIVICRYGPDMMAYYRGLKLKESEARGAAGLVMYPDPAEMNSATAKKTYPDSWWLPPTAIRIGDTFTGGTGDPDTPGYPSIDSAYRLPKPPVHNIPAIPVSYGVAQEMFRNMKGPAAPASWIGGLNVTYRLGPGFGNTDWFVELNISTYNEVTRTYNAIGIIRGEIEPDRYVVFGNHHDAWGYGALDPSSGTAVMMEVARVMGDLVRKGRWRPRRTIIFCSWGSEEMSLIGSTEWVEEYIKNLYHRAVAYVNLDIAVTGNFSIRGLASPPLYRSMHEAAKKVPNPIQSEMDLGRKTVYDTWVQRHPWEDYGVPKISAVGEGSDYATFQRFAGVSCADWRFDYDFHGEKIIFYPLYHTRYETFYSVDTFVDPGFKLHTAVAQLNAELIRSLSDDLLLPMNVTDYAWTMEQWMGDLQKNFAVPLAVSKVQLDNLTNVVSRFKEEAVAFHKKVDGVNRNDPIKMRQMNDQMMLIERAFIDNTEDLPGRPFFRHVLQPFSEGGPGFPGLTEILQALQKSPSDESIKEKVQKHFAAVVFAIQSATTTLKDVANFVRIE